MAEHPNRLIAVSKTIRFAVVPFVATKRAFMATSGFVHLFTGGACDVKFFHLFDLAYPGRMVAGTVP